MIDEIEGEKKKNNYVFLSFISYLAIIKTFIDQIIKRLQHFKRSLDHGLSMRFPFLRFSRFI